MKIKDGFILKNIAGDYVVVPVGKGIADFKLMISLNESAALLWKAMQNDIERDQLTEVLLNEYDVDSTVANADVDEFINLLSDKGIVEI